MEQRNERGKTARNGLKALSQEICTCLTCITCSRFSYSLCWFSVKALQSEWPASSNSIEKLFTGTASIFQTTSAKARRSEQRGSFEIRQSQTRKSLMKDTASEFHVILTNLYCLRSLSDKQQKIRLTTILSAPCTLRARVALCAAFDVHVLYSHGWFW